MASPQRARKDTPVSSAQNLSSELTRSLLKGIYERAVQSGQIPTPDAAMEKMHELVEQLSGGTTRHAESSNHPVALARFDFLRVKREAHHLAVDLYYAALRPRKGAPGFHWNYLARLLELNSKGLSHRKIAIELGFGSSLESTDRVRKQLRIAKRRGGKK